MTRTAAHASSRRLPRGWAHLLGQVGIWLGFYGVYQLARAAAGGSVVDAYRNGAAVVTAEHGLGALFEPALQRAVETSSLLVTLVSYSYWLSEFAVVGLALLWVYFRHYERFSSFRNWLIAANVVGLAVYVALPTAPPRMFPEWGFVDTLAQHSSLNDDSGLIAWAANPYAAMPSLHAMDALIVGLVLAGLCRSYRAKLACLAWPAWVAFTVMATGNHYWLDVVAGFALALVVGGALRRIERAPWPSIRRSSRGRARDTSAARAVHAP